MRPGTGKWWACVLESAASGIDRAQDVGEDAEAIGVAEHLRDLADWARERPRTQLVFGAELATAERR